MPDKPFFNMKPIGKSGTSIVSGVYTEEYLAGLQGHEQIDIYMKMERSDTQVKKVLGAIYNPIKSATWAIESAGDESKDLEVAALIEQILFKDLRWKSKLHEILTFISRGHSVFEIIHENKENKEMGKYTGLANLAFRHQNSLTEWIHDEATGILKSIKQEQSGDIEIKEIYLPVENLLMFFNDKEGDNNGLALLRNLYGAYKRKLLALELKYIGLERFAIPTPIMKMPSKLKPDSQEYLDAIKVLENFTSGSETYLTYPEGYELILHNNIFDPEKTQSAIKSENEAMAGAVIASFLEMGIGGNSGNFALGDSLEKFFSNGIGYFADLITEVINSELIPNLVKLNYGDIVGLYPKITHSGIRDKAGKGLMEVITGYVDKGVITPDEPLEDHVRKVHKLPKKAEGEMIENQESEDTTGDKKEEDNTDEIEDNSGEDEGGEKTLNEKTESKKFADKKAKTPQALISTEADKTYEVMQRNLRLTSEKLINDILRKYNQLSDKKKLNAIKDIKLGYTAKFRKELKAAYTNSATLSLEMVKKEIPQAGNPKLSEAVDFTCKYYDKNFKFNDFSKLPNQVQILLSTQTDLIVGKQQRDLEDRVAFQFTSTESSTNDIEVIRQDLEQAADEIIEGANIKTGAVNSTSLLVNETRNAFQFDDEVIGLVESFTFENSNPKSDICKTLTGMVVKANDAEARRLYPPLHHNCKSYWSANLKISKSTPDITGVPPISKQAKKSITLSDAIEAVIEGSVKCDC